MFKCFLKFPSKSNQSADTISVESFETEDGMDDSGYCCSPVSLLQSEANFDHEDHEDDESILDVELGLNPSGQPESQPDHLIGFGGLCSPLPIEHDDVPSSVKQSCDSNPIDYTGVTNLSLMVSPKTIKKHGKYCRFKSRLRRKIQKCKNVINTVLLA